MKSNVVWNRALGMSNTYRQELAKLSLKMMEEYPDVDIQVLVTVQLATCVELYRRLEGANKGSLLAAAAQTWEMTE